MKFEDIACGLSSAAVSLGIVWIPAKILGLLHMSWLWVLSPLWITSAAWVIFWGFVMAAVAYVCVITDAWFWDSDGFC